jgi:hypothetical protein
MHAHIITSSVYNTDSTMQQEQIANVGCRSFKTGEKTEVASKRQALWSKEGLFTRLTNCLKSLIFIKGTRFT